MHTYRIGAAAALLGVSRDTVRRLVDGGRLLAERDESGRRIIPVSRESAEELQLEPGVPAVAVIKSTNVVVERP
ncbi:excisionase family DNA-binding protein [Streptomyces luteolus]|uniref:MerR family DNA-binding transcriptional regulator n=1 Tax=Streptomyces luteolus TaxID=3043615 RepID=A0ABT6SPC5_9ACTN|nr:excisionase family DNA-binding protein [Streptomyces sp. B-S-A12]MDI3417456.1 MerR family DNA-binding transcriptional regulator [Streptomyces sp. B-S-A12]